MDYSVEYHVRSDADDARLIRALDLYAEAVAQRVDSDGFVMVRSEMRQGRPVKSIRFQTQSDADTFLSVLGDSTTATR